MPLTVELTPAGKQAQWAHPQSLGRGRLKERGAIACHSRRSQALPGEAGLQIPSAYLSGCVPPPPAASVNLHRDGRRCVSAASTGRGWEASVLESCRGRNHMRSKPRRALFRIKWGPCISL
eukprot:scaffold48216_cov36-Prasinocladus_malaysianus.AAC.1